MANGTIAASQLEMLTQSGTGIITIVPPTTNTNRTLTLPDATGTVAVQGGAGVGKVLQVVSTTKTDTFSTTSGSLVDITGLSASITPTSASSKILILGSLCWSISDTVPYLAAFLLLRNSTQISIADAAGSRTRATVGAQGVYNTDNTVFAPINFLDSPATTSATTYKLQVQSESGRTTYVNRGAESDGDSAITARFVSAITLMEIAA
jgi:hypothetical protein